MGWKLIHAHRVAHVLPGLDAGTATSGFSVNNVGTLDVNRRFLVSGNDPIRLSWDRGAATGTGSRADVNGCLILGHNMFTRSANVDIVSSNNATYGISPVSQESNGTVSQNEWWFSGPLDSSGNYDQRYWWIDLDGSTSTFEIGLISLCTYTDLGNAKLPGSSDGGTTVAAPTWAGRGANIFGALGYGGRVQSFQFDNVASADWETIADNYRYTYIPQEGGSGAIDGIGLGGGSIPSALVDENDRPHWGFISLDATISSPGYYRVTVSVDPIPIHFVVS